MLYGMSARTSSDQVQAVCQRIWMLQVEHVWRNLVTQGQYSENRGGRSSGSQHVAHGGFRGRNGGDSFGSKAMMLNDGVEKIPAWLASRAEASYTTCQTLRRVRLNHSYMTAIASFASASRMVAGCVLVAKNLVPKE